MTTAPFARPFILCLLPWLALGCGLPGAILYKTAGPPPVPARWVPPKEPTLVLVENYRNSAGGDIDSDRLGRYITQELKEHDVAPLVDFDAVNHLRDHDPEAYRKMSIAEVGRSVGAKQVIYVSLTDYRVESPSASEMVKGKAAAKVKVIETATGQSRWPTDAADGEPVTAETQYTARDADGSDFPVRDDMNKALAARVGKLFHSWDPEFDNATETGIDKEEPK